MTVNIITSEFQGINDVEAVFTSEDDTIKYFEEHTGYTWEQYLDGDYERNFDKFDTYLRIFEVEVDEFVKTNKG